MATKSSEGTAQAGKCLQCGAVLPALGWQGLCPKCLVHVSLGEAGLAGQAENESAEATPSPIGNGNGTTARIHSGATKTLAVEQPGDRIGRYRLIQQIGEGGCGVVYLAEQTEPVWRRVALKVIKLGMDTKEVLARFDAEQQALALMDHPGIAKVLDAGATDTGRPHFVMELVNGTRITQYCDQNRLTIAQRIELFVEVCRAIQHAHQKGIIHRDIKPSNILVTVADSGPVPKVIDFGVAKATQGRLTDKSVFTAFEQFIGTPAYMSPEQAVLTSLDVDTRSDIYSLGVLLYELLTGKTPFDIKTLMPAGLDEVRRTIREKDPARPSACLSAMQEAELKTIAAQRHTEPSKLLHLLRGDLDWIVMKALEKERARRYDSANALAADIERHLHHEPVVARPPSKRYRLSKLARRNQLAFGAAGAVTLVLISGVIVSTWQAVRATRAQRAEFQSLQQAQEARTRAEANERKAIEAAAQSAQVAQIIKNMLNGVGPAVARGRDPSLVRDLFNQAAAQLSTNLVGQPAVEADLRDTLGIGYRELGDYIQAESMLRQALTLRQQLGGGDDLSLAANFHNLAEVFRLEHEDAKAASTFRVALEMRRRLLGPEHRDVAASIFGLAEVLRRGTNQLVEAEQLHRQALDMRRKLLGDDHLDVANSLTAVGILLRKPPPNLQESERYLRQALTIQRNILGSDNRDVGYTLYNLGVTLRRAEKFVPAEECLLEAVKIQKHVLGDHRDTADSINSLAIMFRAQGRFAEAEPLFRECMDIRKKVLPATDQQVINSLRNFAEIQRLQGKSSEADAPLDSRE